MKREKAHKASAKAGTTRSEKDSSASWHICSRLFRPVSRQFAEDMELLGEALAKARPLNARRRRELPEAIRKLSKTLTSNRAELRQPYWTDPASLSAYLYYFLPWNILRLGQLLSVLRLPDPAKLKKPLFFDIGSGPLALPLALWLCHPEWRELPLRILALDTAPHAMESGKKIFAELACMQGESPWQTICINAPANMAAIKFMEHIRQDEIVWLIGCSNVLNELATKKHSGNKSAVDRAASKGAASYEHAVAALISLVHKYACPALFVEPGTRLGGFTIMKLRETALAQNLHVRAPCTHDRPCPLLSSGRHKSGYPESWCHFTFLPTHVPSWLGKLSEESGLVKNSLSLSLLLLEPYENRKDPLFVRVISQPFAIPSLKGLARYGCAENGLAVLEDAQNLPSGSLVEGKAAQPERLDAKRGLPVFLPRSS